MPSDISHKGYGYAGRAAELVAVPTEHLIGQLTQASVRIVSMSVDQAHVRAWEESLSWLKTALATLVEENPLGGAWGVCLEYEIPRRGYHIDAVLVTDSLILPLEFKSKSADRASQRQVEDYGIELADFHKGSANHLIAPVLCSEGAPFYLADSQEMPSGSVAKVSTTPPLRLAETILDLVRRFSTPDKPAIDFEEWVGSSYEPTPTIIEAATALYAGHSVADLTSSEASASQLEKTEKAVLAQVDAARVNGHKTVCFITGVPGAGKTLAGLNAVNVIPDADATFLTGNGPLVRILREALARDHKTRNGGTLSEARRRSGTFVTNVHRWLDEYIDRFPDREPVERVVVFDEAQRAWTREQSNRKFSRDASEPELMFTAMDRHDDWAVIVALVGGGQEINTGEAGLAEWGKALRRGFRHWKVAISPALLDGSPVTAGTQLFETFPSYLGPSLIVDNDLHLAVSQRTFRNTHVNAWVEAVLDGRQGDARGLAAELHNYPMAITRSLDSCRAWLREKARGLRRSGLVASSGAKRLRPHGISVSEGLESADWFLRDKSDVRSSDYLELAATEFEIQGLELDWIGLCWGGDLRREADSWGFYQFRGTAWNRTKSSERQRYTLNRYRVLLTRAREGLIVWIPEGDSRDPTRAAECYDSNYEYLVSCGLSRI